MPTRLPGAPEPNLLVAAPAPSAARAERAVHGAAARLRLALGGQDHSIELKDTQPEIEVELHRTAR